MASGASPGPLVLVGASLGGMTILIGQAEKPILADGIVLVDIVPKPQLGGVERVRQFMTANPDGFASLDEAAAAVRAYNPRRGPSRDHSGLSKNLRQGDDGRWHWHWDPRILGAGSDLDSLLDGTRATRAAASLSAETLLVFGGDSDVVRREDVQRFRALVPAAQAVSASVASVTKSGRSSFVESPAAVTVSVCVPIGASFGTSSRNCSATLESAAGIAAATG